jgi:hypothetical protein
MDQPDASEAQSPISQELELDEAKQQRYKIAAIATVAGLALFVALALYAVLSGLSRRPSRGLQTANQPEAAQPFVTTPQEAQDYREEPPAKEAQTAPPVEEARSEPTAVARAKDRESVENRLPSRQQDRQPHLTQASPARQQQQPPVVPVSAALPSTTPPRELSQPASRDFDSRLVRARASRTPSGYRYDLTFNMQEQRGRAAQWQRVLITARSASGLNHSQALPFVHRLGGTGALTFTISVELTGRSEADWRGRINCTALGWDNSGAPLQASFAANVTP